MEFIAIISATIALAGLILNGQRVQRAEIKDLRKEMQEQGNGLEKEMKEQGNGLEKEMKEQGEKHSNEITEVKVEVAALKATVETYFRVRVDPPMQSAVAESPEDYDPD